MIYQAFVYSQFYHSGFEVVVYYCEDDKLFQLDAKSKNVQVSAYSEDEAKQLAILKVRKMLDNVR
jgi:hypothetical protein